MEGIDKVQILNDEVKILKNEIKDILVEIKEMLITLPQNMSMSYSLDETGGPKHERRMPEYEQSYPEPANQGFPPPPQPPVQQQAAPLQQAQQIMQPQFAQPQMQQPQFAQPQAQQFQPQMQQPQPSISADTVNRLENAVQELRETKLRDKGDRTSSREWEDDEEIRSGESHRKAREKARAKAEEEAMEDMEEEKARAHVKKEALEELQAEEAASARAGEEAADARAGEEIKVKEKTMPQEMKKEMQKKEAKSQEKPAELSPQAVTAGDVDIVTLATFSRWLNSGMNRLGKERMHEIIEVSAAMGGISSTMKDILLRLLQMDNGQGYIVKESLAVLIDLDNLLMRNKKSREESAVLSLFINERDEVRG